MFNTFIICKDLKYASLILTPPFVYYNILCKIFVSKGVELVNFFDRLKNAEIQPKIDLRESILSRFIFELDKLYALILLHFGIKKEVD